MGDEAKEGRRYYGVTLRALGLFHLETAAAEGDGQLGPESETCGAAIQFGKTGIGGQKSALQGDTVQLGLMSATILVIGGESTALAEMAAELESNNRLGTGVGGAAFLGRAETVILNAQSNERGQLQLTVIEQVKTVAEINEAE